MPLGPVLSEPQTQPIMIQPLSLGDDSAPDFGKKKKKKVITNRSFNDAYELTGVVLGEGASSVVKECRDRKHGVAFAAKFISKKGDSFSRQKVLAEVAILQKCKGQETILQISEYFEETDNFILVFEKIDGGPLMDHIKGSHAFSERNASLVVKDVATALAFLHERGIAHRDIKPENILCVFKGRVTPVKLCDFNLGASKELESMDELSMSMPVGTPEFMSPEVADAVTGNHRHPFDELADVWSLGVILHIMLTGTAPFSGDCGQDCGWKRGQACESCAEDLFDNISRGRIDFSAKCWENISGAAKDLIARMLVRASERLTARQVLLHPWVVQTPPDTPLATPAKLGTTSFDSFVSEANEKLRIADTKAVASEPISLRRPSQNRLATSFSSVVGYDLLDIRTPRFTASPLGQRASLGTPSPGTRSRSSDRIISPLANSSGISDCNDISLTDD